MVQGITTGGSLESLVQTGKGTTKQKSSGSQALMEDSVSLGKESQTAATYTRSLICGADAADGPTGLKDLVHRLLDRQGITWETAMAGETVEIDDETRAEAKALIADDGYWGVEQTSTRIFNMAVAHAGGDTEKLDQIKAAIEKGFEMAKETLGGALPEISMATYDAVMKKLDNWAADTDNA
jgi:anti-sigma28 factor (negative regulator of flagellin synthesis)